MILTFKQQFSMIMVFYACIEQCKTLTANFTVPFEDIIFIQWQLLLQFKEMFDSLHFKESKYRSMLVSFITFAKNYKSNFTRFCLLHSQGQHPISSFSDVLDSVEFCFRSDFLTMA